MGVIHRGDSETWRIVSIVNAALVLLLFVLNAAIGNSTSCSDNAEIACIYFERRVYFRRNLNLVRLYELLRDHSFLRATEKVTDIVANVLGI